MTSANPYWRIQRKYTAKTTAYLVALTIADKRFPLDGAQPAVATTILDGFLNGFCEGVYQYP